MPTTEEIVARINWLEWIRKQYVEGGIGPMSAGVGKRIEEIDKELEELRAEEQ